MNKLFTTGWFKAVLVALIFSAGCTVTYWYMDRQMLDLKLQYSQTEVVGLKDAARDLQDAALSVTNAANNSKIEIGKVDGKLNTIAKEIKNNKPLPVDCKPDADRVRQLKQAIDTANSASTR